MVNFQELIRHPPYLRQYKYSRLTGISPSAARGVTGFVSEDVLLFDLGTSTLLPFLPFSLFINIGRVARNVLFIFNSRMWQTNQRLDNALVF